MNPVKYIGIFLSVLISYGREDEEVMGLRFCNEAVMCLAQIWPPIVDPKDVSLTPLQVREMLEMMLSFQVIAAESNSLPS